MDTNIFDTEKSLTNVTKVFIELSTSHIHRNMIRKLRSLNCKSAYFLVLAVSIIAVIFAAQQHQAYASKSAFDQGYADGREARLNGYSNKAYCDPNNNAPNPDAYCALYKSGFAAGWAAADLLYGDQ
jgi:hypothetical protein